MIVHKVSGVLILVIVSLVCINGAQINGTEKGLSKTDCGETLTANKIDQILPYMTLENVKKCVWTIVGEDNTIILLTIDTSWMLENIDENYLLIRDGPGSEAEEIGLYTRDDAEEEITLSTSSNMAYIEFSLNSGGHYGFTGFLLSYVALEGCYWESGVSGTGGDFPEPYKLQGTEKRTINYPPLIYDMNDEIVLPEQIGGKNIIRRPLFTTLRLTCSGVPLPEERLSNYFVHGSFRGAPTIRATCNGGSWLRFDEGHTIDQTPLVYTMKDMGCSTSVSEKTQHFRDHQGDCKDWENKPIANVNQHDIGFMIYDGNFRSQIKACFDPTTLQTVRTEHTLHGANIGAKPKSDISNSFRTDKELFKDISMNDIYTGNEQEKLFLHLFGDVVRSHFFNRIDRYLQRGHMVPNGDFVTLPQRHATYLYLNAFPQWAIINSGGYHISKKTGKSKWRDGNWKLLEDDIRSFAAREKREFRIFTGGEGILTFIYQLNGNLQTVPIYLQYREDTTGSIHGLVPVPQYTWKIVYDTYLKTAAVFVNVNSHRQKEYIADYKELCDTSNDLCNALDWLYTLTKEYRDDFNFGYTYCCYYDDFKLNAANVPYLELQEGGLHDSLLDGK